MNRSVESQIECVSCTWNKFCVEPPSMTKEEVDKKIEEAKSEVREKGGAEGEMFAGLLSTMMYTGKDSECPACPVFIKRLRESPDLANHIKEYMKSK